MGPFIEECSAAAENAVCKLLHTNMNKTLSKLSADPRSIFDFLPAYCEQNDADRFCRLIDRLLSKARKFAAEKPQEKYTQNAQSKH